MPSELVLSLLGGVQIRLDGAPMEFTTRKEAALLIYLACTGRPHTRESLEERFWDERSAGQAHSNLRTLLSRLHRSLGPFLRVTREQVALDPRGGRYWLDVAEFSARAGARQPWRGRIEGLPRVAADKLAQALRLYRGDFLAGFHVRGASGFEEWAEVERERLRRQAGEGLRALASFYLRRGRFAEGIENAVHLLAADPLDEEAHRQMMLLLAYGGQRGAALAQYKACQQVLARELNIEPSPKTQALYARIRDGERVGPSIALPPVLASSLPLAMTPLIGRRQELALLRMLLLDPGCRLVTIVGLGGVGKTRLALAAAEEVMGDFVDGVWFVPLAGVESMPAGGQATDLLVQAIARALRLPFSPGSEPRVQLIEYLRQRELLLVLDNLELLLDAGTDLIIELLNKAPYVTVLVTSRQRLDLQAEQVVHIEGLAVPPLGALPLIAEDGTATYPFSSVQLFVELARRNRAGFALHRSNVQDVARICRLTEGLPLAIELAAARVEEVECAEIAQSIQRSLDWLTTARRDMPERHRSLRAVLESSWHSLAAPEQRVLSQAVIFCGDFGQEAAAAVAQATSADLVALVDRSLLRRSGPGRYEMHALVRQFALEHLYLVSSAAGPGAAQAEPSPRPEGVSELQARYCSYFLGLLDQHETALYGPTPGKVMEEMQREVANIQQAWRWAVEDGFVGDIGRSAGALARFLRLSGLFREGNELFRSAAVRLQALLGAVGPAARDVQSALGRVLVEQAGFLITLSEYSEAVDLARQGVALAQCAQVPEVEAIGYLYWGSGLLVLGDYTLARSYLVRALELARTAGRRWLEAESLRRLGIIERDLGNYGAARTDFEQAWEIFEAIGDRDGAGTVLDNLGIVASDQSDFAAARAYYEQALPIFQETGYRLGQVSVRTNLGTLLVRLGDYAGAQANYEEALNTLRDMGGRLGEALLLNNLGNTAYLLGNHEAAYEYAQQSLDIARESSERGAQGYALDLLGHILAGLEQFAAAAFSYQEALVIWEELGQKHLMLESLAGLARVALAQGDVARAGEHVARILAYVDEAGSIRGTDEDVLIYLTCYRVLAAAHDPRAREILRTAYTLLQERAGQMADEALRKDFLQKPPVHREVVQAWEVGE